MKRLTICAAVLGGALLSGGAPCDYAGTCCGSDAGGFFAVDGTQAYCNLAVYECTLPNGSIFAYLVNPGPLSTSNLAEWNNNDLGGLTDLCNANFAAAPNWGQPCESYDDPNCTWAILAAGPYQNAPLTWQTQEWLQTQAPQQCQGQCQGSLFWTSNIHFNDCSNSNSQNCQVDSAGNWYGGQGNGPRDGDALVQTMIGSTLLQMALDQDPVWISDEGPQPGATGNNLWAIFRVLRYVP
jgi:hypothetical protein